MGRYRLRAELYFCIHQARAVFLDAETGRYFALPAQTDAAFRRLCKDGETTAADDALLAPMVKHGLLILASAVFSNAGFPMPPLCYGDIERQPMPPSGRIVWLALVAQFSAEIARRRRTFAALKRAIIAAKPMAETAQGQSQGHHREIGKAFQATTLLFRPADRCLPQSIAYLSVCRRVGLDPNLVFGIRSHPFAAHCWVQHENCVVYDTIDGARTFTPILVL